MPGKLEIWNMALGFIGTRTVAGENERTEAAIQCGLFWDTARRTALRDYPWNFAWSRGRLAEIPLPDVWAGVWRHAYALPDSCLKLLRVTGERGGRREAFVIVHGDGREMLLADRGNALAEYIVDVTETSRWDDAFCAAMARKLACLICVPLLKNNPGKVQELESLYRASLPPAELADAGERHERPEPDSWLMARAGMV